MRQILSMGSYVKFLRDDLCFEHWEHEPITTGRGTVPDWFPYSDGRHFAVGIDIKKIEVILKQPVVPKGVTQSPPKVMKFSMTEACALSLPIAYVNTKTEAVAIATMAQKFFGGLARAEPL